MAQSEKVSFPRGLEGCLGLKIYHERKTVSHRERVRYLRTLRWSVRVLSDQGVSDSQTKRLKKLRAKPPKKEKYTSSFFLSWGESIYSVFFVKKRCLSEIQTSFLCLEFLPSLEYEFRYNYKNYEPAKRVISRDLLFKTNKTPAHSCWSFFIFMWRHLPESNRPPELCRLLYNRSTKAPRRMRIRR